MSGSWLKHLHFVGVMAVGLLTAAPARATCGSASCFLVTGTREGLQAQGSVTLDVSYQYVDQSKKLSGSHNTGEVLTPKVNFESGELEPDHHREIRTQNSLIDVGIFWGVSDRFSLLTTLPLFNDRFHEHDDDVGTPDEFFTNNDGTSGFGDVQIGGRYAFLARPVDLLVGGLSAELPTGPYKLRDSEGEINEPTIQPGSGSTDWRISLDYDHQWMPNRLESFLSGSYKFNTENDLDYQLGDEAQLNAGIRYVVGARVTLSFQANGRRTDRDAYKNEKVDSTGATFVNLTPGITLTQGAGSFYAFVQLPVSQDVNEAQLAPRASLLVGFSRTL